MKKIEKGFTVAELLLVVGVIGLGTGAIYVLNEVTNNSNEAFQEVQRLVNYSTTSEAAIATNGNYNDVNIEFLEKYGLVVDTRNGFSNVISNSPSSLSFIYKGVSAKFCSKFITNVLTTESKFKIKINDVEVNKSGDYITDIAMNCAVGNVNLEFIQTASLTVNTLTAENLIPAYTYDSGNPSTISTKGITLLSNIPIISGQSYSFEPATVDVTGIGFSFKEVIHTNPSSPGAPPVNSSNPIRDSAGPDLDVPSNNVPSNAVVTASGAFKIDTWGIINVNATQLKVSLSNLFPLKSYRLEFVSKAFSLTSNNPVVLGDMNGSRSLIDELTVVVKSDKNGVAAFDNTNPMDVSHYFRTSLGVDKDNQPITDPKEPMNDSLESYFQNTISNYPMTVDIISADNENLFKSLDFSPVWYITSPFVEMLKTYGEGSKSLLHNYSFNVICKGNVKACLGYNDDLSTGNIGDVAKPKKDKWSFKAPTRSGKPASRIEFTQRNDWVDFTGEGSLQSTQ